MDYLDFGSSSDSDGEGHQMACLDSDEEEQADNNRILKMLSMKSAGSTKGGQKVLDFEAEMEAELDRRAMFIESEGGMEHQRSLSRSSSSSSLHSLPNSKPSTSCATSGESHQSQSPKLAIAPGSSCLKKRLPTKAAPAGPNRKKAVKFENNLEPGSSTSTQNTQKTDADTVPIDTGSNAPTDDSFYDKVYFDSDESEGEDDSMKTSKKSKRKLMSNDDLFYDPESDAADQAWVDKQRRQYYKPGSKKIMSQSSESTAPAPSNTPPSTNSTNEVPISSNNTEVPLPRTDAVLNCPACFSVLCMDCQRHEFYAGQYRAMFVMNCKVDRSETLTVPLKTNKGKDKGKNRNASASDTTISNISNGDKDTFFPVRCKVCNSQVAVYDSEEIYHFFNCLASHP